MKKELIKKVVEKLKVKYFKNKKEQIILEVEDYPEGVDEELILPILEDGKIKFLIGKK